jgi:hypothetical protein
MTQRILVVPTARIPDSVIRSQLGELMGDDVELEIVAPASDIGRLDWLTNAEDDARAKAAHRAEQTARELPADPVETQVGDTDPLQAIEDALRTFPADEVVIVTRPDDEASWLEKDAGSSAQKRFGVPVKHIVVPST